MGTCGIYYIHNIATGQGYIGSAKDIRARWDGHVRDLARGLHVNRGLQLAWQKYGEDAFRFEVLEEVNDEDNLLDREQYWIGEYRKTTTLYNIATAQGEPRKGTKVTFTFSLDSVGDEDVVSWLNRQDNRSKAIRDALRAFITEGSNLPDVLEQLMRQTYERSLLRSNSLAKRTGIPIEPYEPSRPITRTEILAALDRIEQKVIALAAQRSAKPEPAAEPPDVAAALDRLGV